MNQMAKYHHFIKIISKDKNTLNIIGFIIIVMVKSELNTSKNLHVSWLNTLNTLITTS